MTKAYLRIYSQIGERVTEIPFRRSFELNRPLQSRDTPLYPIAVQCNALPNASDHPKLVKVNDKCAVSPVQSTPSLFIVAVRW